MLGVIWTALTTLDYQYAATLQLPEDDPYHPWELRFLDKSDTMPRYMRAAKWYAPICTGICRRLVLTSPRKLEDAKKRIEKTIEWRRDFKPDLIPPEEVPL